MPKTIRNEYYKKLSYENLMKAHNLSKKGKGYRKEIIIFNLKKKNIQNGIDIQNAMKHLERTWETITY